jgi:hypothetical protein
LDDKERKKKEKPRRIEKIEVRIERFSHRYLVA